jgi:hypothetical protein
LLADGFNEEHATGFVTLPEKTSTNSEEASTKKEKR